jgi:penicillin-insensitive murein DD-endopeptidase
VKRITVAAGLCALLAAPHVPALDNPWAKVRQPAAGQSQSIGKYTAGCLLGAHSLEDGTPGLIHMRPQRRRNFGHESLIELIHGLGQHMNHQTLGTVLVGDLGMPRGGPTMTNHVSHQSGLDVDIWFDVEKGRTALSTKVRRTRRASSYVNWKKKRLDKRFGAAQVELIKWSATRPNVQRVFVNPVIKRHLCDTEIGDRDWLAKVRPWWGHADHLHVRLRCPTTDPHCRAQNSVPQGDGCDDSLRWWLTRADTDRAARKKTAKPKPRRLPNLPKACAEVLAQP